MLTTQTKKKRALVIGAGPMGLETALRAIEKGFETTVIEAGRVGENLRSWGHIHMFSPFEMNVSPFARRYISGAIPQKDTIQNGHDFVETVLEPLARSEILKDKIITNRKIISITRTGLGKTGLPNHPLRAGKSFRVLSEDSTGKEYVQHADFIFDASGVFNQPNWGGVAGMPAPGERKLAEKILRQPINIEQYSQRFAGKRILIIGHGAFCCKCHCANGGFNEGAPGYQSYLGNTFRSYTPRLLKLQRILWQHELLLQKQRIILLRVRQRTGGFCEEQRSRVFQIQKKMRE